MFQMESGDAFTSSKVRSMLYYMFRHPKVTRFVPGHHKDAKGMPRYTFHSWRRTFATNLARANADRPRIQSMVRWLAEESVDLYDKLSLDDQANYVEAAYLNNPDCVTPASIINMPIDDGELYEAWCEQCSVHIEQFTPDFESQTQQSQNAQSRVRAGGSYLSLS